MKKTKNIWKGLVVVLLLAMGMNLLHNTNANDSNVVSASEGVSNKELMSSGLSWKYLDDNTDPNVGTWYEEWNKRNGWAYPLDFLDWGTVPMRFSEEGWSDGSGPFSSDSTKFGGTQLAKKEDGKIGSTYFFRYTFDLDNPEDIVAISGNVRYNDAIILYVNGKPVESLFNIPISNYPKNLTYGATEKVTDDYIEESFVMEDVTSLRKGLNTIAVELHTYDEEDTSAYFEMLSFMLNPSTESLPETEAVKNVSLNVGEDENQMNFTWYSLSSNPSAVQIAKKDDQVGDEFPVDKAITINATTDEAYTKFYDKTYYYNKASFNELQRSTNYIYRVGNSDGYSTIRELNTQSIDDGYGFVFISDAQVGTGTIPTDKYGWNHTLEQAFSLYPDASFILNTGDMVDVANKEVEYDAYFSPEKLGNYPSATTPGNHDIDETYKQHFNEPNISSYGSNIASGDYYYTYGNTIFYVLNANNNNNAEHIQFLKETAQAQNGQSYDWQVVMFHQSVYAAGTQSKYEVNTQRRIDLVPTIDELGIDLVFMGHDHCYARTNHMKNLESMPVTNMKDGYEIDPEGTLFVTMSSASGSKYYDIYADYEYSAKQLQLYVPTFAYMKFEGDAFEMVTYRTDTLEVIDSYKMRKTSLQDTLNTTALEELVKKAEKVDTALYTDESVAPFNVALQEAKKLLNDGGIATFALPSQTAIDEAYQKLQTAMDGLVKKAIKETPNQNKPSKNPSTSDTTNIALWIGLLTVSGVVIVIKKKKQYS